MSDSNQAADSAFFKMFGVVLGALVLFTVIIMGLANIVGGKEKPMDEFALTAIANRVAPVSSVRTGDVPVAAEVVAKSPEELYAVCAACHDSGAAGAPKRGDAAAWEARLGAGLDALVQSAIVGKGGMPPRGASTYDDAQMAEVVKYLVGQ